ncbi:MAG: hypothetical protein HZA50_12350 [Planctomycetes bacterium]|nr:hypothetical protein [Planctomycetota bacterium]
METFEIFGWTATAMALIGAWLNNRKLRFCFVLWLASNAMTFGMHAWVAMWSLAARDVAFFVLAMHGWLLWGHKNRQERGNQT